MRRSIDPRATAGLIAVLIWMAATAGPSPRFGAHPARGVAVVGPSAGGRPPASKRGRADWRSHRTVCRRTPRCPDPVCAGPRAGRRWTACAVPVAGSGAAHALILRTEADRPRGRARRSASSTRQRPLPGLPSDVPAATAFTPSWRTFSGGVRRDHRRGVVPEWRAGVAIPSLEHARDAGRRGRAVSSTPEGLRDAPPRVGAPRPARRGSAI